MTGTETTFPHHPCYIGQTMNEDQKDRQPRPSLEAKLPYERPAVISEEVFETLALSCANAQFVCPPGSTDRS